MFRRSMILAMAAGALTSCGKEPTFVAVAPKTAPPPTRIERLLLWLPANDRAIDARQMADAFKAKFSALGVAVSVGRSNALELERSDDQKPFVDAFRPTHRLEIEVAASVTMGGLAGPALSRAVFRATLYSGTGKSPLLIMQYGASATPIPEFVKKVVEKLQADGYL